MCLQITFKTLLNWEDLVVADNHILLLKTVEKVPTTVLRLKYDTTCKNRLSKQGNSEIMSWNGGWQRKQELKNVNILRYMIYDILYANDNLWTLEYKQNVW